VDISLTISPLRDREGKIIGASKIARDISERKRAEEALCRAHEELERRVTDRTKELADANDALQEKILDLETFHDVAVGRELKMVELEKELSQLKAKRNTNH
jgi:C4-dicarboxylate-specific signal transduction histidine kinase